MPTVHDALPAAGTDGKEVAQVQAMFDRVAARYDLANTVLSFGQDAHWRRVAARAADPAGARVLDVASGPGELSKQVLALGAREVVAADLSHAMLSVGHERARSGALPDVRFVQADALDLPLPDAAADGGTGFDAVTIAFGLRNLPDPARGLREFARVARPGARMVVLEFAAPTNPAFRRLYLGYLMRALPAVARAVSSHGAAYGYLADSIREWPDRRVVAGWMEDAGWRDVRVKDLTGGIVAVHRGVKA